MRGFQFSSCRRADGSGARRAIWRALILGAAVIPRVTAAQQEAHYEVLTILPENVGTCLPPLFKAVPGDRIQHGNRLVLRNPEPFMSREISTVSDREGQSLVYSDRSQVTTASVRTLSVSITGMVAPNGVVSGFRIESTLTVPDSVLRARDLAAIQQIIDGGTGTSATRALDSTELSRVRSMLEFIRKRCP